MSIQSYIERAPGCLGWRLSSLYARWAGWYMLGMVVLWYAGVEGVYRHPAPVYAYYLPVFEPRALFFLILAIFAGLFILWRFVLYKDPGRRRWELWLAGSAAAAALALFAAFLYRSMPAPLASPATLLEALWLGLYWHLPAITVFFACMAVWRYALDHMSWFGEPLEPRPRRWLLVGLLGFVIVFSLSIAMVRDGLAGVAAAYDVRHAHEYINDIGTGGSIKGLFRDYVDIHPYLSTHAKVHPPGPIVVLWLLADFIAGREPLGLSIATVVFGSLALFPLYHWTRDMTNQRVALTACLLYVLMPGIVLFTATSADILFMPFTLTTLFLFWRALHGQALRPASLLYALGAGVLYGVLSLLSFSLLSIGAFFGFMGLWRLRDPARRIAVVQTAAVMLLGFFALHLAVRWWSGFDVIACFQVCKAQFDDDQLFLNLTAPRYPGWVYRILNPLCWLLFAGIPVSVLAIWRWRRPPSDAGTKGLFVVFLLTLLVLDVFYLARGEGERSAMYVYPFMVIPAAHLLDRFGEATKSYAPLLVTQTFLAVQCWLTESFLYTYW